MRQGGSQTRTLAEATEQRLAADILSGQLSPGQQLRLQDMMERYGVGMSPIREALARLCGRNLVHQNGQRGFVVAPVSLAELTDLSQTRIRLDSVALRASIDAGDADWEANVLAAHHRLSRHPRRNEKLIDESWESLHRAFHFTLFAACGSPRLLAFCHTLYDEFDRYRRLAVIAASRHPTITPSHGRMVQAALNRDADTAVKIQCDHIEEAKVEVLRLAGAALFPELMTQPDRAFSQPSRLGSDSVRLDSPKAQED